VAIHHYNRPPPAAEEEVDVGTTITTTTIITAASEEEDIILALAGEEACTWVDLRVGGVLVLECGSKLEHPQPQPQQHSVAWPIPWEGPHLPLAPCPRPNNRECPATPTHTPTDLPNTTVPLPQPTPCTPPCK